jgi:hypothetical protein
LLVNAERRSLMPPPAALSRAVKRSVSLVQSPEHPKRRSCRATSGPASAIANRVSGRCAVGGV